MRTPTSSTGAHAHPARAKVIDVIVPGKLGPVDNINDLTTYQQYRDDGQNARPRTVGFNNVNRGHPSYLISNRKARLMHAKPVLNDHWYDEIRGIDDRPGRSTFFKFTVPAPQYVLFDLLDSYATDADDSAYEPLEHGLSLYLYSGPANPPPGLGPYYWAENDGLVLHAANLDNDFQYRGRPRLSAYVTPDTTWYLEVASTESGRGPVDYYEIS